ncbi:deoxi-UTP pyrophosphatase [Bacillus phage vB_BcgM]|nr:deoxi-UTP pyrophosphatase [Bacillus phage vB_BcgM]
MAVKKEVQITLMNGDIAYIPEETFITAGIADAPEAVIGNAVRGSRTPVFHVNKQADMSGEWLYVIAQNIMSFKVTHK